MALSCFSGCRLDDWLAIAVLDGKREERGGLLTALRRPLHSPYFTSLGRHSPSPERRNVPSGCHSIPRLAPSRVKVI